MQGVCLSRYACNKAGRNVVRLTRKRTFTAEGGGTLRDG